MVAWITTWIKDFYWLLKNFYQSENIEKATMENKPESTLEKNKKYCNRTVADVKIDHAFCSSHLSKKTNSARGHLETSH